MPDIEVPLMWVLFPGFPYDHLLLHSIVGAMTLGLTAAVFATVFIYPQLVAFMFGLDREAIAEECQISRILVVSALIGLLSHLLLDVTMHWYNPLLWPWVEPEALVGPLVLLLAFDGDIQVTGFTLARVLVHGIMLLLFVAILARERGDGIWRRLWVTG
jgi:membrane-bound metal-dependent hydrolase YbcI (DUF457 family)